jgi:hypothetical protein
MHLLHIHGLYNLSYVLGLNNVYVDFRKMSGENLHTTILNII